MTLGRRFCIFSTVSRTGCVTLLIVDLIFCIVCYGTKRVMIRASPFLWCMVMDAVADWVWRRCNCQAKQRLGMSKVNVALVSGVSVLVSR